MNPPRIPIVKNILNAGDIRKRSSNAVIKNPMRKHPIIFMVKIPKGKFVPANLGMTPESQYRKAAPSPPPRKTNK